MLGSLILYLKGMRIMMFQLSGFYCKRVQGLGQFAHETTTPNITLTKPFDLELFDS